MSKLLTIFVIIALLAYSCKSTSSSDEPKVEVGKGYFSALPIDKENFNFFVNLGHLSQPGHTFPSGHGGFVLTDHMNPVPVYSPADIVVTAITSLEHINHGYTDYGLNLSVNDFEFSIKLGHMSQIHHSILNQVGDLSDEDCEQYSTSGDDYRLCLQWTEIPVFAGDTLGMVGGNPGQFGLDFGVYDKSKPNELATDRFDDYGYPYSVSPLDYFTDEIVDYLALICGGYLHGSPFVRTKPPIGGTINYDVEGTAQGIWFKEGEPISPEDPHIALVYHNADPDIPLFSVGISIPGLVSGPYTYSVKETGLIDRAFYDVKPDGNIYVYNSWYLSNNPYGHMRLLIQMLDETHLKVEMQDTSTTEPWQFTNNAVIFDR